MRAPAGPPGFAQLGEPGIDCEDDEEEEEEWQGHPHPPYKPSRRPKPHKHWVISRFNPSHKPSQGVPARPIPFLIFDLRRSEDYV